MPAPSIRQRSRGSLGLRRLPGGLGVLDKGTFAQARASCYRLSPQGLEPRGDVGELGKGQGAIPKFRLEFHGCGKCLL